MDISTLIVVEPGVEPIEVAATSDCCTSGPQTDR